jgi:hypothetical protein
MQGLAARLNLKRSQGRPRAEQRNGSNFEVPIHGILGIDVSKSTLDVSVSGDNKMRTKSFTNSSDGWRHLLDWLITHWIG